MFAINIKLGNLKDKLYSTVKISKRLRATNMRVMAKSFNLKLNQFQLIIILSPSQTMKKTMIQRQTSKKLKKNHKISQRVINYLRL